MLAGLWSWIVCEHVAPRPYWNPYEAVHVFFDSYSILKPTPNGPPGVVQVPCGFHIWVARSRVNPFSRKLSRFRTNNLVDGP
jgi:hypothetical protein